MKIKIFKKLLQLMEDKKKTIDLIFMGDKYDEIKIGDEIIYKNGKNIKTITVKGILYFKKIDDALNAINTKNLVSKSPLKAYEWYSKNYPEFIKNEVMIINF
jgi:ASC-1-like (ASCH) protein